MENITLEVAVGGIFSRFVRCVDKISTYNNCDFFTFKTVDDRHQVFGGQNLFDSIFHFDYSKTYTPVFCDRWNTHIDLINHGELKVLRNKVSKLKIKSNILEVVEKYKKENNIQNTLGVHIRQTDMHALHPLYGKFEFDSYKRCIDSHIANNNNYDNIFVSVDNRESLQKMQNYYGKKIKFFNCKYIVDYEYSDNYHNQLINFCTPDFWIETFTNMLILSKTKHLIYRVSDYSNAAILFSDSIHSTTLVGKS